MLYGNAGSVLFGTPRWLTHHSLLNQLHSWDWDGDNAKAKKKLNVWRYLFHGPCTNFFLIAIKAMDPPSC